MKTIIKHENQRNERDKGESCQFENAILLKWSDGRFYYKPLEGVETFHQDKYTICHDIIADIVFNQLGHSSAYTSSSSIAGHHDMDYTEITLIFWKGEPVLLWDDQEDSNTTEEVYNHFEEF